MTAEPPPGLEAESRKEVLFLYEDHLNNIRDLKRYEWESARYAILMEAGLLAISRVPGASIGWLMKLVLIMTCGLIVLGWRAVDKTLQASLSRHRAGMNRAKELLSAVAREALSWEPPDREGMRRTLLQVVGGAAIAVGIAICVG